MTVARSTGASHTYRMLEAAFAYVGRTGMRLDAQIMAAVPYDFPTDVPGADARAVDALRPGSCSGLGRYAS
jgi:hypothetical protein